MRHCTSLIVLAAFLGFGLGSSANAQGKSKSAKPPTAATVSHGPKTTTGPKTTAATHGPKTTTAKQGAAATAKGPKTTSARGPKTTTSGGQKAASARPTQAAGKGNTATQTTQTGVVTTTLAPNVPKNQQLADRLRQRLGLPLGADLTSYAAGFRNQGQFIAAVNNSFNHQISFTELKNLMVNQGLSLGEAKQRLGVSANTQDQVRRVPPPPQ